eukprot:TRINITY_DN2392_c0_g1_i1.p1 TRINITY_DN2392_c0_g1~~TRINITY_DN2392_c0_g1_i1.p1  ORF type:complete len:155 (-),score=15.33 TRINITY_DN2392_c0_g1_i1:170-634(-)
MEKELETIKETKEKWGKIIKLNVGGKYFATYITTLTSYPDSMLAAMFSGRHELIKDENGCVFIDRDGKTFEYILSFLREHENWEPPTDASLLRRVQNEFRYFQLPYPSKSNTTTSLGTFYIPNSPNIPYFGSPLGVSRNINSTASRKGRSRGLT